MTKVACLMIVLAASLGAAEGEVELSVAANGLRVVSKTAGEDEALRPFSAPAGTSVALLVSSPKGGLIQFDPESSALARFTDDKGNDLLAKVTSKKTGAGGDVVAVAEFAGFSMFPKISKDGKFCALEVLAPNAPAKDSSRLRVEGVITMLCANQKSEQVIKDVALKNGTEIAVPGMEHSARIAPVKGKDEPKNAATESDLTLDNVGKPDFGDDPFSLTLRSHSKMDNVAEIRFFKADGTEIKSHQTGTSKMAILGSLTVEWTYGSAEKADVATIKVFIWTDMQKKKTAFKLDVDVGL